MAVSTYNFVVVDGKTDPFVFVSDGSALLTGDLVLPRCISNFENITSETVSFSDSSVVSCLASATPVSLVNPGAETGNTIGWVNESGSLGIGTSSPTPHSGTYFFNAGATSLCKAYQRIDLVSLFPQIANSIDGGAITALLSWYQASLDAASDPGCMGFRFLDSSLSPISTSMADNIYTTPALTWVSRSFSQVLPVNTRYLDVIISATRTSGTDNDAYFDDITLSLL